MTGGELFDASPMVCANHKIVLCFYLYLFEVGSVLMLCVDGLVQVGGNISFANLLTISEVDVMGALQFNSNL